MAYVNQRYNNNNNSNNRKRRNTEESGDGISINIILYILCRPRPWQYFILNILKYSKDDYKRQRVGSESGIVIEDELETYLFRLADPNDPNRVIYIFRYIPLNKKICKRCKLSLTHIKKFC